MRYLIILLVSAGLGYYAFGLGYNSDCCKCVAEQIARDKFSGKVQNRELERVGSLGGAVGSVWVRNKGYVGCRTGFRVPRPILRYCRVATANLICQAAPKLPRAHSGTR